VIARRAFLAALGGSLAVPLAAGAQARLDRVARIGYLTLDLKGGDPRPLEAFRQGLRDLGYVEGKNLQIEYRDAEGKPERLRPLAAELIALKVDVIVATSGTAGAQAAKRATTTVSIVFPAVADPVMDGLVTSFARPAATSPAPRSSPRSSLRSRWSCSRRRFREPVGSPCS
jgi:putative ABC transport system substrate-binding protein